LATLVEVDEETLPKRSLMEALATPGTPIGPKEAEDLRVLVRRYRAGKSLYIKERRFGRRARTIAFAAAAAIFVFVFVCAVATISSHSGARSGAAPERAPSDTKSLVVAEESVDLELPARSPHVRAPAPVPGDHVRASAPTKAKAPHHAAPPVRIARAPRAAAPAGPKTFTPESI
jgi:hypothetical protein